MCAHSNDVFYFFYFFFFQAEDGIRDKLVTGVQTCALPISSRPPPMIEIGMNENGRVNGRLPRYHQIAGALRTRIREGALRPGARLDNQRRLAKSFGVTLMTLRQALELLEREHLIARRHGLGTFVAAPSIDYDILQLRRFAGDLSA